MNESNSVCKISSRDGPLSNVTTVESDCDAQPRTDHINQLPGSSEVVVSEFGANTIPVECTGTLLYQHFIAHLGLCPR